MHREVGIAIENASESDAECDRYGSKRQITQVGRSDKTDNFCQEKTGDNRVKDSSEFFSE